MHCKKIMFSVPVTITKHQNVHQDDNQNDSRYTNNRILTNICRRRSEKRQGFMGRYLKTRLHILCHFASPVKVS